MPYEADSITPFVANSPLLSEFYKDPLEYKQHLTHEGELIPEKREWQVANNTYVFSDWLGRSGSDDRVVGSGPCIYIDHSSRQATTCCERQLTGGRS